MAAPALRAASYSTRYKPLLRGRVRFEITGSLAAPNSGTLIAATTVSVVVQASALRLSPAPAVVVVGQEFAVAVDGVDSFGNVDKDYTLGALNQLTVQDAVGSIAVTPPALRLGTDNQVLLTISGANDGETHTIRLSDSNSALNGTVDVEVDVQAGVLQVVGASQIIPDADNTLTIQAVDAVGNLDIGVLLFTSALMVVVTQGETTVTHQVVGVPPANRQGTAQLRLNFSDLTVDGSTVRITVSDAGLNGAGVFPVNVQTRKLRLSHIVPDPNTLSEVEGEITAGREFRIGVEGFG